MTLNGYAWQLNSGLSLDTLTPNLGGQELESLPVRQLFPNRPHLITISDRLSAAADRPGPEELRRAVREEVRQNLGNKGGAHRELPKGGAPPPRSPVNIAAETCGY
jgi:hypothetical protein